MKCCTARLLCYIYET